MKLRQPRPGSWWKTEGQTVCEDLMPISKPRFQPGESRRQCWTGGRRRKDRDKGGRTEEVGGESRNMGDCTRACPSLCEQCQGQVRALTLGDCRLTTHHAGHSPQAPPGVPSPDRLNP